MPHVLRHSFWRGNQGWTSDVIFEGDTLPAYDHFSSWEGPFSTNDLADNNPGPILCQTSFPFLNGKKLRQSYWRGWLKHEKGYTRDIDIESNGFPNFPNGSSSQDSWSGPWNLNSINDSDIDSAPMEAQSSVVIPNENVLIQTYWRGSQEYRRKLNIVASTGLPSKQDFEDPTTWMPGNNLFTLGTEYFAPILCQTTFLTPDGNTLREYYWQGWDNSPGSERGYCRDIDISDGLPGIVGPWKAMPLNLASLAMPVEAVGPLQSQTSFVLKDVTV
ncbi:MAG: hypothetical protein F6K58_21765 [Symploca sp. SIO2E9]|nr:hypothetical protein [Symploca sp. SIO2E9]